ncbi:MAG: RNA 2',3'-cyclic phosphodiesterase [Acidimicrobiales bacterium]
MRGQQAAWEEAGAVGGEPTERLFVGVWPPPEVVAVVSALERPASDALRWTSPVHWHVTLAFLGSVPGARVGEVQAALVAAMANAAAPPEARLGPATRRVGRSHLWVPVEGLEGLAGVVRRALGDLRPDAGLDEPFLGHLTLARARGRHAVPASLAGVPIEACWLVREVRLVRSELGHSGARYTTLLTATVAP